MAHVHDDVRTPARVVAEGFGWRHAGRRQPALADVNFRIEPGEKVLLLGTSGSGKSTLMAGMAGVLGDSDDGDYAGRLLINGVDARSVRGQVGLVLQDPDSQVISSRVGDDIAFGCENLGFPRAEIWERVRWARDLVGLTVPLDHPTEQLSGGQKQRLALAGVLAMGAGLILLDEPTANIDPEGVADVRKAVIAAAESTGATVIIVEHRVDVWRDVVDRIMVVGDSTIRADGPTDEVIRTMGEQLAHDGVWIPDVPLPLDNSWRRERQGRAASDQHRVVSDQQRAVSVGANEVGAHEGRGASTRNTLLRTHDLAVGWNGHAVNTGLSLDVTPEPTVITGPNGAGKSTVALTLAGLLAPVAGDIDASALIAREGSGKATSVAIHRKRDASSNPMEWSSRALAQRIGTVFQDPEHQFVARTVRDELLVGPRVCGIDPDVGERRADELLRRLHLENLANANPFTLSGGQKRRLSVATVLSTHPDVVIADEPTFGQDRTTFIQLIELLREMSDDGVGVLAITHDPLVVDLLGVRHVRLASGGMEVQR
ncbi:energy-coupling factor ABC transporter ATP-binding protein [Corynebacterium sp. MC-04]|uniref:Energy-coupling factor ABC transporter ATP-binding protein n=1 Tax=Corynebacterium parakroppenstedtii TaxID=2828363 RepID=A0ABS9HKV5_9CORY|nr:ABC transporter ATP-binding protein [Corynebacterium parakroppenstedtii]KXB50380.1 ABC transporter, ATP-binding protein [Corynebacterium kroppenstedtii]MCZ9303372.1 energy-coupling factor ABC transporter ATP-binding protein [Corynebacterium sp. c24U_166]MBY0789030.1 ABC transporter ATP-binding protein [Corynebacterium parakroppenstedtii]MBY0793093.1 ABC transporter ATP-binding protein [Corynebacterium parakroppenstedtii]MBY0797665.1 ABC transporter ATP-binding protein [Corynebacterium parak